MHALPSPRILPFAIATGVLLLGVPRFDSETTAVGSAQASPRSPSDSPTTKAASAITRKVSDAPTGHLEHPARLAALFSRFQELETKQAKTDVRLVQFGDSHTASDYGTSVARLRLTARFGSGGRGFIPMGAPYKRLFQAGESVSRGIAFEPDETTLPANRGRSDGFFGPTGIAMDGRVLGASMTSELSASADRFEIAYLAQPAGGSFDIYVDGQRRTRIATNQASRASAFRTFEVERGSHSLEARAVGDGSVRIFGVRLDDDAVGLTLDSLGINGAKATTLLGTDEANFTEQVAHVAPALAIFAYGTNESGDTTTTPDDHAEAIKALAKRAKKGAPGAQCLVLGPPDRGSRTLPKLIELIAAQRRAADESGCAFYDQLAAMGGPGAIGRWASESPPRARRDFVHLTRAGYAFVAEALVHDLVMAYDNWKSANSVASR